MKNAAIILVVDDNMKFVDRIINLLKETNSPRQFHIASNYDEAIYLMADVKPDIILLDINLPGKSGIEILKVIKSQQNEAYIIMLTNHAEDYYRQICIELGANYFLDKSEDFGLVPEIVNQLILDQFQKN